ncbi:MAG: YciI family protein [Pseudomonadota bacterium]
MPKFVFAYHGGEMKEDPVEAQKAMDAWGAWYGAMGAAVLDGGGPAGPSKTVSATGVAEDGGSNPLSGLTVVEASDQDAAVEMAKGCPILEDGGTVEVAEVLQM